MGIYDSCQDPIMKSCLTRSVKLKKIVDIKFFTCKIMTEVVLANRLTLTLYVYFSYHDLTKNAV